MSNHVTATPTAAEIFFGAIEKSASSALSLVSVLTPADRLRTLRDLKKRIEAAEKAAAETVKANHHPSLGERSFAYATEVAGSTSWKVVAEKLAADAGITLDDAFCAPFKGSPSTRVEVKELYDLVSILKDRPVVAAIDFETNGFLPSDGAVAIGVATSDLDALEGVLEYSMIHLEGRPFNPRAAETHGLREEELATAPRWSEIASKFTSLLKGAVLVGHNIAFELRFLEALGVRKSWIAEIDTLVLAKMQRPDLDSYKLDSVAKAYEVDGRQEPVHDAAEDAKIALWIFMQQASEAGAV